jgi:hypothetical protein
LIPSPHDFSDLIPRPYFSYEQLHSVITPATQHHRSTPSGVQRDGLELLSSAPFHNRMNWAVSRTGVFLNAIDLRRQLSDDLSATLENSSCIVAQRLPKLDELRYSDLEQFEETFSHRKIVVANSTFVRFPGDRSPGAVSVGAQLTVWVQHQSVG